MLSPSYVSLIRPASNALLDIVEALLAEALYHSVVLDRLENGVPVEWEKHRTMLS